MDWLIKNLGLSSLLMLLPMILIRIGTLIKNKDANDTGMDDAFGNVLIAVAPAVVAYESGSETSFKKALKSVYIALGNYLGYPPPA